MSNPTTPFSWQMPTNTDLVTDLPADFEVFGQAVATSMQDLLGGTTGQILSKASNTDMDFTWTSANPGDITGVTAGVGISGGGTSGDVTVTNSMATAMTTSGDLIQATGSGTFARLATGTSGQYLTTNGTTNSWVTPTVAGANFTLLNAGGTNLTAAGTVTVSGISGASKILIILDSASCAAANSEMSILLNGDTGANYYRYGPAYQATSTYSSGLFFGTGATGGNDTRFYLLQMGTSASNAAGAYVLIDGCNSSGVKVIQGSGYSQGTNQVSSTQGGYYNSASTISSVSAFSAQSNFDAGKIYVYTSA